MSSRSATYGCPTPYRHSRENAAAPPPITAPPRVVVGHHVLRCDRGGGGGAGPQPSSEPPLAHTSYVPPVGSRGDPPPRSCVAWPPADRNSLPVPAVGGHGGGPDGSGDTPCTLFLNGLPRTIQNAFQLQPYVPPEGLTSLRVKYSNGRDVGFAEYATVARGVAALRWFAALQELKRELATWSQPAPSGRLLDYATGVAALAREPAPLQQLCSASVLSAEWATSSATYRPRPTQPTTNTTAAVWTAPAMVGAVPPPPPVGESRRAAVGAGCGWAALPPPPPPPPQPPQPQHKQPQPLPPPCQVDATTALNTNLPSRTIFVRLKQNFAHLKDAQPVAAVEAEQDTSTAGMTTTTTVEEKRETDMSREAEGKEGEEEEERIEQTEGGTEAPPLVAPVYRSVEGTPAQRRMFSIIAHHHHHHYFYRKGPPLFTPPLSLLTSSFLMASTPPAVPGGAAHSGDAPSSVCDGEPGGRSALQPPPRQQPPQQPHEAPAPSPAAAPARAARTVSHSDADHSSSSTAASSEASKNKRDALEDKRFELATRVLCEDFFSDRFPGFECYCAYGTPPFAGGCFVRFERAEDALTCLSWLKRNEALHELFIVQFARKDCT